MRKVILYIAISVDGYIADSSNSVSWLTGDGSNEKHPGSYGDFIKQVDSIILGNTTYTQIINELSPNYWVYSEKKTHVITSKNLEKMNKEKSLNSTIKDEDISFYNVKPSTLVKKLKEEEGKNIWICGGASVVQELIITDLIDVFHISVIPTLLGSGIRLFNNFDKEVKLKLTSTLSYNGIVDLVYKKR